VLLCSSYSNAQVDSTTGNLINNGTTPTDTTSTWNNGVYVNTLCFQAGQPGNCGPNPSVRASGGNINFSYGTVDLNQVVNINRALAAGGSGVQLSGFNFGFMAKNGNGWDDARQDYLAAYVKFYDAAGSLAANYDYSKQTNAKYNWTQFNFSETFANPVAASNYSNARVGFVGRDNNYWAGNYGPEIFNVSFSLKYRVDPCSTNPAYAPTCAGFGSVVTSGNLVNPNLMSNGDIVYNSFAVNTALKNSGAGVEVYGFNYGYNYSLGNGRYECTATNQDGSCSWYMTTNPIAQVKVRLTDNNNDVIYNAAQSRNTPNTAENVSYQFLLPKTTNSLSLGTFTLGANTSGNAAIQNMFVNALYKPDPCVDPLSSPSCPGYATAYAKNMILGSTVAAASAPAAAPAAAAPALAQAAPALADPSPAAASPATAQTAPAQQAPAPAQDSNQNPSLAQDNPAQPSPQQAGPAPTSPQPAGGPPQTATASAPPPSAGPSQAGPQQSGPQQSGGGGPSKLAMSVVKSAQEKDKAIQQMAVQNAAKVVEGSTQQSQATALAAINSLNDMSAGSANAAAQFASQTTQASVQTQQVQQGSQQTNQQTAGMTMASRYTQQTQQTQEVQQVQMSQGAQQMQLPMSNTNPWQELQLTSLSMFRPPSSSQQETTVSTYSGTGLTVRNTTMGVSTYLAPQTNTQLALAPSQPQFRNESKNIEVEMPLIMPSTSMGKPGNSWSDLTQSRTDLTSNSLENRSETVKKNVEINELAGGVDITLLALQPRGYDLYSVTLKDADFYAPKDIYGNQKTVDNARALRQLSSDRLHQEMMDQQYKGK
jgi:hypothetical protein